MPVISEEEFNRALDLYQTAGTRRYHTKDLVPAQSVREHSFGMLLLCEAFYPSASANLLRAIIHHDLPENRSMDAPHELKCKYEVLREIDEFETQEFYEEFQLFRPELTEVEELWLKFFDGLEVLCYLQSYVEPSWQSAEIFERQSIKTDEIAKKLQSFGFLSEPDNQVH